MYIRRDFIVFHFFAQIVFQIFFVFFICFYSNRQFFEKTFAFK